MQVPVHASASSDIYVTLDFEAANPAVHYCYIHPRRWTRNRDLVEDGGILMRVLFPEPMGNRLSRIMREME